MRQLSRRTLVRMMEIMEWLDRTAAPPQPSDHDIVVRAPQAKYWSRLLYENDFPDSFISHAEKEYDFAWDAILRDLREGKFFFVSSRTDSATIFGREMYLTEIDAKNMGESMIQRLAALLCTRPGGESLRRSLELDGYGVKVEKLELVPLEGVVSQHEEEDRFTQLLHSVGLPNETIALRHLGNASSLYLFDRDRPSLGESRSFLQAVFDGISTETDRLGGHPVELPRATEDQIEYLRAVGFLTPEEEAAFQSGLDSLCAGFHPGVPTREHTRMGLVLALALGQQLILKFKNWKEHQCKQFSSPEDLPE